MYVRRGGLTRYFSIINRCENRKYKKLKGGPRKKYKMLKIEAKTVNIKYVRGVREKNIKYVRGVQEKNMYVRRGLSKNFPVTPPPYDFFGIALREWSLRGGS